LASTFPSEQKPIKILEKRERGRIQGLPNFLGTPYYPRSGKMYGIQIRPVHSEGPSEQKPIKNFGETAAWAADISRDCPIFWGTPYYLRKRKSYGFVCLYFCIAATWRIQDEYISILASTFRGSIRALKILEKRGRGRIQGLPNFFGYPLLSEEPVTLRISNVACTLIG